MQEQILSLLQGMNTKLNSLEQELETQKAAIEEAKKPPEPQEKSTFNSVRNEAMQVAFNQRQGKSDVVPPSIPELAEQIGDTKRTRY